jgi:hypothetical protein
VHAEIALLISVDIQAAHHNGSLDRQFEDAGHHLAVHVTDGERTSDLDGEKASFVIPGIGHSTPEAEVAG